MSSCNTDRKLIASAMRFCALGLLASLLVSLHLWIGERAIIPRFPLYEELIPFEKPLYAILLGAMALLIAFPLSASLVVLSLTSLSLLIGADRLRLQPWVFEFFVIGGAVVLGRIRRREQALPAVLVMILGSIYFWSGLNKFNSVFINYIFYSLSTALIPARMGSGLEHLVPYASYGAALLETAAGLLLFLGRAQRIAAWVLVGMHCFILLAIGPLGRNMNPVVWPWNLFMCALLVRIFLLDSTPIRLTSAWRDPLVASIVGIAMIALPMTRVVTAYPAYLSWELYTGKVWRAVVVIADEEKDSLPTDVRAHLIKTSGALGELAHYAHVVPYVESYLGAPPWPERDILLRIGLHICKRSTGPTKTLHLALTPPPQLFAKELPSPSFYSCETLTNQPF